MIEVRPQSFLLWAGWDLNPQPFRDTVLSRKRIPVPPPAPMSASLPRTKLCSGAGFRHLGATKDWRP